MCNGVPCHAVCSCFCGGCRCSVLAWPPVKTPDLVAETRTQVQSLWSSQTAYVGYLATPSRHATHAAPCFASALVATYKHHFQLSKQCHLITKAKTSASIKLDITSVNVRVMYKAANFSRASRYGTCICKIDEFELGLYHREFQFFSLDHREFHSFVIKIVHHSFIVHHHSLCNSSILLCNLASLNKRPSIRRHIQNKSQVNSGLVRLHSALGWKHRQDRTFLDDFLRCIQQRISTELYQRTQSHTNQLFVVHFVPSSSQPYRRNPGSGTQRLVLWNHFRKDVPVSPNFRFRRAWPRCWRHCLCHCDLS